MVSKSKKESEAMPLQRLIPPPDVVDIPASPPNQDTAMDAAWESLGTADQVKAFSKIKGLLSGGSGSGKTTLAAKFGRTLHVISEPQAFPTIQQWNPKAIPLLVKDMNDIGKFFRLVADPRLAERVDAVAIDSLTDIQRIIKNYYFGKQSAAAEAKGKDADRASIATWQSVIDATSRFARVVRDLPVHVIVIVLDEVENGHHTPSLYGRKLPNELAQFFNLVGFISRQDHGKGMRREVLFDETDRYITKPMTGIDGVSPPEPLWWAHQRFGTPVPDDVRKRVDEWRERGPDDVSIPKELATENGKEDTDKHAMTTDEEDPFKK